MVAFRQASRFVKRSLLRSSLTRAPVAPPQSDETRGASTGGGSSRASVGPSYTRAGRSLHPNPPPEPATVAPYAQDAGRRHAAPGTRPYSSTPQRCGLRSTLTRRGAVLARSRPFVRTAPPGRCTHRTVDGARTLYAHATGAHDPGPPDRGADARGVPKLRSVGSRNPSLGLYVQGWVRHRGGGRAASGERGRLAGCIGRGSSGRGGVGCRCRCRCRRSCGRRAGRGCRRWISGRGR